MNMKNRLSKLEKHLKSLGIDAKNGLLLEPIQEGHFLWAIKPNRDWQAFFNENKGKNIDDLWNSILNETAADVWADYEE